MTSHPKSRFLMTMQERGFLDDCTDIDDLDEALLAGPVAAYIGFDATANSLHVGSLIQIMMLRWFQKTGNKPIILMGGGTTKVGDPSFRPTERPLLTSEQISANIAGIRRIFENYITFGDGPTDAVILDNAAWLDSLNYLTFLREIGRHFSVNRMLAFDSVKSRLDREQSLSFLEFNYMILQSYDFLVLNRDWHCILQMGGSDQWGNIVNGVDLIRRVEGTQTYGLTSPLLTTASGAKMGKTADGAVWLNSDMRSPFDFWQFWRNTDDADVQKFLKLFTELELDEINRLGGLQDSEINEAKRVLADKATELAHGKQAALEASNTASAVYERGKTGEALPTLDIKSTDLVDGLPITQLLVQSGLAESGKAARRLIAGGAVKANGNAVTDASLRLKESMLLEPMVLTAGRKRHAAIRLIR